MRVSSQTIAVIMNPAAELSERERKPGTLMGNGLRHLKRMLVLLFGGTVLLLGIALIVLPGPAFLVIPLGLAILGIEFAWARQLLHKARSLFPAKKKPQK